MCMYTKNIMAIKNVVETSDLDEMQLYALRNLAQTNTYLKYFYDGFNEDNMVYTSYIKIALDYYLEAKEKLQDGIKFMKDPLGFDVEDLSEMARISSGSPFAYGSGIGFEIGPRGLAEHLKSLV